MSGLRGYDAWKTRSDLDEYPENFPEYFSECDCCGEMKEGCEDVVAYGLDTHACPKCRSEEEDDTADRGDFDCHQERDQ